MPLTMEDIRRITALGFKVDEFAIFNGYYWQLRNINGHCYFLNPKTNKCKIYPYRPIGCKIYPIIYIENIGVSVDSECPMAYTVTEKEIEEAAPILIRIIKEIEGEDEENN